MSVVRFNPMSDVFSFQRDLNRLFDTLVPAPRRSADAEPETAVWRPAVDVHEDENGFYIDLELPGLSREDVKINFQEGTLTVSGERRYAHEKSEPAGNPENGESGNAPVQAREKSVHRMERIYGRFFRSFNLPSTVNPEGIRARFDNGVLTVSVPKAEKLKPRQIEIG